VLAPLGAIGYLLWQNDQWWNYGAMTALPLIWLGVWREMRDEGEPSYESWGDGPWGPP
jgi:hypothetical protein